MSAPIRITEQTIERVPDANRTLMLSRRQALIIELGAIEDYLGMDRSIVPRRKRSPDELRRRFDAVTKRME